jgi:carboxymethylenebutenolidase
MKLYLACTTREGAVKFGNLLNIMKKLTRRKFVATGLAAGFAAAVLPISAQTISTDANGLTAGDVEIPANDGKQLPGYRAMPAQGGPFPTILVIQEIFGVHEHIKDVCRRLAKLGYLAVAPALFVRQGDVSQLKDHKEIIEKVVKKVPDWQVMSDLDSTVEWAEKNGGDTKRLGITGFCWGGRITWLYAARSQKIKAGVAWYGKLKGERNDTTPEFPIDAAKSLKAPVRGLYGEEDTGIPMDTVNAMKVELRDRGSKAEILLYKAPHAFFADYRPSYRPEAAADAWKKMLEWFDQHGVK